MAEMGFEEIRGRVKKELKNPNPYTNNRLQGFQERCEKSFGQKAVNEISREFTSGKRTFSTGISFDENGKVK